MTYQDYRSLVEHHVKAGTHTGAEISEALSQYTQLNHQRMKRLDKTMRLKPEHLSLLEDLDLEAYFLVITESWCGDAAQTIPMINKVATAAGIDLKIVLRDQNLELMDEFLTEGNRAIAKLILVSRIDHQVLGTWGPRPTPAASMVQTEKKLKGRLSPAFKERLQLWYNKDKGKSTERDLVSLLQSALDKM